VKHNRVPIGTRRTLPARQWVLFPTATNRPLCFRIPCRALRAVCCRPLTGRSCGGFTISVLRIDWRLRASRLPINDPSAQRQSEGVSFPFPRSEACYTCIDQRFIDGEGLARGKSRKLLATLREARDLIPPDLILVRCGSLAGARPNSHMRALLRRTTDCLSHRTPYRQYRSISGYSSSFVETLDVPEIVAPFTASAGCNPVHRTCEVEYSVMLRTDATNSWTSIQGFGHGHLWAARGGRFSLSSLADDGGQTCAGQTRPHWRPLDPHVHGCSSSYSRNVRVE